MLHYVSMPYYPRLLEDLPDDLVVVNCSECGRLLQSHRLRQNQSFARQFLPVAAWATIDGLFQLCRECFAISGQINELGMLSDDPELAEIASGKDQVSNVRLANYRPPVEPRDGVRHIPVRVIT